MRQTNIICTIGPVSQSFEMLDRMIDQGMDIVRLNMSHGDHEAHAKVIKAITTLNRKKGTAVPIMLDTQGPEIRTGNLQQELHLEEGAEVSIAVRPSDVEESSFHIDYRDLMEQVEVGDRITVDNGLINLDVLEKQAPLLRCQVVDGGLLKSKRHVNLPGIRVNLPAITEKDRADILFGVDMEVDFIALSFVREAQDIRDLRQLLGEKGDKIKVIAKIEDQEGLKNLAEIIAEADGIMVARGDLGVEIPLEELPNVQRDIVCQCHQAGKRVIVATHLLESMIENPIPTRAEATDVANAVYEEVDAVMLSGETTVGKYPLKCIEYLDRIAQVAERQSGLRFCQQLRQDSLKQSLAASAVSLAESIQARGILVFTRQGVMANLATNCRPLNVPIFAFTNTGRTRRQLSLNRAVVAIKMTFSSEPEKTLAAAMALLTERQQLASGDQVVVISEVLAGAGIDGVQVRQIP